MFPPVWGANSCNWGAGMHQIEKAAGILKANMPLGNPDLTEQEAWDVALDINSHERPQDPRWLGSVEATRAAYHDNVSMYRNHYARQPDGRHGCAVAQTRAAAVGELEQHMETRRIGHGRRRLAASRRPDNPVPSAKGPGANG